MQTPLPRPSDDPVDIGSDLSFPASDPPSHNQPTLGNESEQGTIEPDAWPRGHAPEPATDLGDRDSAPRADQLPGRGLGVALDGGSLDQVARLATECQACDLWARATQTVFGTGPAPAPLMLVGEQPGDREDVVGEPFVGPAGRVLDQALERAGIDRSRVFVTNVVKHFRWRPSGKRRLHEKPTKAQIRACAPWFEAELAIVRPEAIVCLGATAATALLGPDIRVSQLAGTPVASTLAPLALVTVHPSAVLRAGGGDAARAAFERLVGDLRLVADRTPKARLEPSS